MSKIQQPVQAIKMTNVAIVRYKHQGKRFEIACYKNKVMNWRNKIEKDLNEVLQSNFIFTNVSKGVTANNADLNSVFHTTDVTTIAIEILDKGEVQVSEKERATELESKFKDIAQVITDKCINSETKRPFSIGMIERSMRELHFSVKPNRTTKQQALELMKSLKSVLPIERAQMRLKLELPLGTAKQLKVKLAPLFQQVESEEFGAAFLEMLVLIDPGSYRAVEDLLSKECKGKFQMEILDLKVQEVGEAQIEAAEAERENKHVNPHADSEEEEEEEDKSSIELASQVRDMKLHDGETAKKSGGGKTGKASKGGKGKKNRHPDSDDEDAIPSIALPGEESDSDDNSKRRGNNKKKANKATAAAAAASAHARHSEEEADVAAMAMAPKKKQLKAQAKKKVAAALARQGADSGSDSGSESQDDSDAQSHKSKQKSKPKKKKASSSEDSSESSESDNESKKKKQKAAADKKKKKVASSSSSESESDVESKSKAKPSSKASSASSSKHAAAPPASSKSSGGRRRRKGSSDEEEIIKVPNQSQIDAEEREEAEAAAKLKADKAKKKDAKKKSKGKGSDSD